MTSGPETTVSDINEQYLLVLKILATSEDTEMIGIPKKAADAATEFVKEQQMRLSGEIEEPLTVEELRDLLVRLSPDVENMFSARIGVVRIMDSVARELFEDSSNAAPEDIARFRWALKRALNGEKFTKK